MPYFVFMILISLMIIVALSVIMPVASYLLSEKIPDKEKSSVYECGFSPMYQPGKPFSMSFFIMAILFLVFDLEMILLFPWSLSMNKMCLEGQEAALMFFVILVVGLAYEWFKGGLEWE